MPKSRKTGKQENLVSTPETSRPSSKIELDPALRQRLRSLSPRERQRIGLALNQAAAAWGHPHLHVGVGLRKLTRTYYECRSGLQTRLVFKALKNDMLYFFLLGNHDEIRRFIRTTR